VLSAQTLRVAHVVRDRDQHRDPVVTPLGIHELVDRRRVGWQQRVDQQQLGIGLHGKTGNLVPEPGRVPLGVTCRPAPDAVVDWIESLSHTG